MNSKPTTLSELLNEMRQSIHFNPSDILSILKNAQDVGLNIDHATLQTIVKNHTGAGTELFFLPEILPNFASKLLKPSDPGNILDPWGKAGAFTTPIYQNLSRGKITEINRNKEAHDIAELLGKDINAEWLNGDPLTLLDEISEKFDAIVSSLPFKARTKSPYAQEIGTTDTASLIAIKSCQKLALTGTAFFVVPASFFFTQEKNSARNLLPSFGFHVNAAFSIPIGAFRPLASIKTYLIVVQRQEEEKLFVGEISEDEDQNNILISNYENKKDGSVPQQGVFVERNSFMDFDTQALHFEIQNLTAKTNLPIVQFKEIANSIETVRNEDDAINADNTIFLPVYPRSKVSTHISDIDLEKQNYRKYIKITLRKDKALDTYVSTFLNTPLGVKIRESISFGTTIKRINQKLLLDTEIPLPPFSLQREVIQANTEIQKTTLRLTELQAKLWEDPLQIKKIRENIAGNTTQKKQTDFTSWTDTLHFPLASILRNYEATKNPKDKNEHLFHFFEATSQFITTIFLSVYRQNPSFYNQNKASWNNQKYEGWYEKASFGNWVKINFSLAKVARKLFADTKNGGYELCLSLFGKADENFIQMLTNKRLHNILDQANQLRNTWKGHSGVVSEDEAERRLLKLEELLTELRGIISNNFSEVSLLIPGKNTFSNDIFNYEVKLLQGTRTPFIQENVKTVIPMDIEKLYLLPKGKNRPIELLPFGKMMSSPQTAKNAFYFYNRMEKDSVRWVSYHFEEDADITQPDSAIQELMRELFEDN